MPLRLIDRLRRPLAWADAGMNRLYGWRYNPLYHSGVIAAALFAVVIVTGLYLLFFYRIGAPYESVARITERIWLGQWSRSLHRYASDGAILFAVIHAFRMLVQHRSWGPRTLAWLSGLVLFAVMFLCGWTGYVMVWDIQGEVLAREGARWMDALPLFSEPISRAFDGERPLPGAFFFLNLFAHVALPIGVGVVLWVHVARVARPVLVPPTRLAWGITLVLSAASLLLPVTMSPPADVFRLPGRAEYDVFYAFFLPLTMRMPPWSVWVLGLTVTALTCAIPWLTRPRAGAQQPPSTVDERSCTGCEQCYLDCPYEAIAMVPRGDGRPYLLAQVDPGLCTSCGICTGSCAPMGVGPAGRTGKDLLKAAKLFHATHPYEGAVVVAACQHGAGGVGYRDDVDGSPVFTVSCAGNLHSSVVEYFVRSGAAGVLVVSCPPRDCWNREGGTWLEQRLYHDREAELQPRVDRRRVRVCCAGEAERGVVQSALAVYRRDLAALGPVTAEAAPDVGTECEAPVTAMIGDGR
jgi:ferredoxin